MTSTHPSKRERVFRLKGGKVSTEHVIVGLQFRILPLEPLGFVQLVAELLIGIGLLVGGLTRLFGFGAVFFFFNLFLAYFGGREWIWTYVLLTAASLAVALPYAGRTWGVDGWLKERFGDPPIDILW